MPKPNLLSKAAEPPLTALSTPDTGKDTKPTISPHIALNTVSRAKMWADAKRVYYDEVPYRTCLAIWGTEVVDARRTEDCPECSYAGDIFVLCPYHQYRECECGAILGTVTLCKCDPEK